MDDFTFDAGLNRFFKSASGAGSRITEKDEATKRQLTVAKHERDLLLKYHPNLPIGSLAEAEKRGEQTSFSFRKFPTGQAIGLRLNFPKPKKNELRLYFSEEVFSPRALDMWFVFERQNEIWIGSLDDTELDAARQGVPLDLQNGFDQTTEEAYQDAINSKVPDLVATSTLKYRRDPSVAIDAFMASGHRCELLPNHPTFISRVTEKPYLEAHHFIPMMEQRYFSVSLDVAENICILNPYAHKMLHHAKYSEIAPLLISLAKPRADFLKRIGVSIDGVLRSYGGP